MKLLGPHDGAWQDATLFCSFGLPNAPRVAPFLETTLRDVARARLFFSQRASPSRQEGHVLYDDGVKKETRKVSGVCMRTCTIFCFFFFGWLRKQIGDNRSNNGSAHC